MRHYITSDLHLHDDEQPYLFTDAKQAIFVQMAEEILANGSTLVLAGDVLDLTGLQPPAKGMADFFAKALPGQPAPPAVAQRSVTERVHAIRARFPKFFSALGSLAAEQRLQLVPGNHDFELTTEEGRAALADVLGVSVERLVLQDTTRIGEFLVAAHGHEFDPSNQTTDGVENRGALITRVLYQAVVPALRILGVQEADAIPAVRPEENVVTGLEGLLTKAKLHEFLVAFVELLRVNGYFHGLADAEVWVATHLLTPLLSPENVRKQLADDTGISMTTRQAAEEVLSGKRTLQGVIPPLPTVLILGHTHERDSTENYVNLATWIDHVTGLSPTELAAADRTLPVVVIDGTSATQYNVQHLSAPSSVDQCPVFWTYAGQ
jgi:UDP-2,3-diacylglucosamine pyrophosphatase LpxH